MNINQFRFLSDSNNLLFMVKNHVGLENLLIFAQNYY